MNSKKKRRLLYAFLLALPPLLVFAYAALLLWVTWPIQELSVAKSGVFGDSFGLLNALFSGLAFAGVIVTILLQKNELQLQRRELRESREQFKRGASAQERSARISALSALLIEYKEQIAKYEHSLRNNLYGRSHVERLQRELAELHEKKNETVEDLENNLREGRGLLG